jgi:hypothetical protein
MPSLPIHCVRFHSAQAHASLRYHAGRDTQLQDRGQSSTAPSVNIPANPGNTAGPVLPHRPSETPPVLRNHREGPVTCSTVATCTEKTTPVGSLVTQRKHRRFPGRLSCCTHPSAARGTSQSPASAAASSPGSPVLSVTPAESGSPGSSGCPAGPG